MPATVGLNAAGTPGEYSRGASGTTSTLRAPPANTSVAAAFILGGGRGRGAEEGMAGATPCDGRRNVSRGGEEVGGGAWKAGGRAGGKGAPTGEEPSVCIHASLLRIHCS